MILIYLFFSVEFESVAVALGKGVTSCAVNGACGFGRLLLHFCVFLQI